MSNIDVKLLTYQPAVAQTQQPAVKPGDKPAEPRDTFKKSENNEGWLKTGAKAILGAGMAAVYAPVLAVAKGSVASSKAALEGIGLGGFKKDGLISNVTRAGMYALPLAASVAAAGMGLGPAGIAIGFLVASGVVGGTAAAVQGALDGTGKAAKIAVGVGRTVGKVVSKVAGKTAGHIADSFATTALALSGIPIGAALGAVARGTDFALKSLKIKENEASVYEKIGSAIGKVALLPGAAAGTYFAVQQAGPLGAAVGAIIPGSVASAAKGTAGFVEGLIEGVKQSFNAASTAVEQITGYKKE